MPPPSSEPPSYQARVFSWRALAAATVFFTRIPLTVRGDLRPSEPAAAPWAPLIGWLVGTIGAAALLVGLSLLPVSVAIIGCLVACVVVTGGLHEDGLADTADALGVSPNRDRMLEVMRDPRIGTFGILGLIAVLSAKGLALYEVVYRFPLLGYSEIEQGLFFAFLLIAAHASSRFFCISLMATQDYARPESSGEGDAPVKAKAMSVRMGLGRLSFAAVLGFLPTYVIAFVAPKLTLPFFAALALAFVVRILFGRWCAARLGGYTGDCLGATQQLTETAFYLGVAMTLPRVFLFGP